MSLTPQDLPTVPPPPATTVRAAFPQGKRYMPMRAELGPFYADQDFAALCATPGQPAEPPWRLARVLVFQFAEGVAAAQAADAVRRRIDWQSALRLALRAPGLDACVVSEFRTRSVAGPAAPQVLATLLPRFKAAGLLQAADRLNAVLAAVRQVKRLVLGAESVRQALHTLAGAATPFGAGVGGALWRPPGGVSGCPRARRRT